MTKGPPNAGSLAVENTPWQEVEEVVPLVEFLLHVGVLVGLLFGEVLGPFPLIHANELLHLEKEVQPFGPWNRPLTNLVTPVLGRTLDERVILLLVDQVNQKVFEVVLVLVQIFEQGADEVI